MSSTCPRKGCGRLVAGALVLGVLLGAEGASRQVEGHRDVRGALVLQEREEHGDEPWTALVDWPVDVVKLSTGNA